jgi:hypothetical protein
MVLCFIFYLSDSPILQLLEGNVGLLFTNRSHQEVLE